jgi:hypothetical protein
MQIQPPGRGERAPPDTGELRADARLRIFCQRNIAAPDMQHRRFAPVEAIAEIQVERPVPAQLRVRFASMAALASVSPWLRAVKRLAPWPSSAP